MQHLRLVMAVSFFILTAIQFLIFSVSVNAASCDIEFADAGEISSRTRSVQFDDGREIIVVGHNHGDRMFPNHLRDLALTGIDQMKNEDFQMRLEQWIQEMRRPILHAKGDLKYLHKLLRQRPDILFVGVEMTESSAQNNLITYAGLQAGFIKGVQQRGLEFSYESLLLVAQGAASYLKINGPSWLSGRRLIGFESKEANSEYNKAAWAAEELRAALRAEASVDRKFLGKIAGTDLQLSLKYPSYDPSAEEQILIAEIKSADVPDEYRSSTMLWFLARLREMKALKDRERSVVEGMLARQQSGVLFMGERHLDSIASLISKKCMKSKPVSTNALSSGLNP